ncbi:MAG: contractile injection system protein, VgrG/Pvc8 family [Rhodospirillales bacterium]
MPDANPELHIDGQIYGGWTEVSVTRDIERMAGAFDLKLTDKWPGIESARAVLPGQACRLTDAGDTLVTGWLDDVGLDLGASDHTISAVGRDSTGDLVDCAAIHAGGGWADQALQEIAEDICRPFGITVQADAAEAKSSIRRFQLEDGETAFAAIERLCRIKGVLPTSTPAGRLLLTSADRAQRSGATLRQGDGGNVLSVNARFSHSQRFSQYIVKGQNAGYEEVSGDDAAGAKGEAGDPGITRYRPTIIQAEDSVDAGACERRAKWEASVRRGRARRATVMVQGWRLGQLLWRPLTRVDCNIPKLNLAGEMLVTAVTYSLSEQDGTTAELTLADPAAFTGLAIGENPEDEPDWGWSK